MACTRARVGLKAEYSPLVPAGSIITKATLSFYVAKNDWGNPTCMVGRITQTWNITDKWGITIAQTSDDPPTLPVTVASPWVATVTYSPANGGWIDFDVTTAVQYFMTNPTKNYGFIIVGNPESAFWSSDYTADITKRPKITVTHETSATPVVSAVRQKSSAITGMRNGRFSYSFTDGAAHRISVFASDGKSIMRASVFGSGVVDLSKYATGCHAVMIDNRAIVVHLGMQD